MTRDIDRLLVATRERQARHRQATTDLGPLFASPAPSSLTSPKGMVRAGDHETSLEAAARARNIVKPLQSAILAAYRRLGPMTAKEVERLPEFRHLAPSTSRKRVSELASPKYFDPPRLVETGAKRDGCAEYRLTERP